MQFLMVINGLALTSQTLFIPLILDGVFVVFQSNTFK